MSPGSVLHAIQLAVAPIFMLAAVAAMIGTVATRLARIIDRARVLEGRLESATAKNTDAVYWELDRLKLRGRVCNWSVALLAVCGMLIGATVSMAKSRLQPASLQCHPCRSQDYPAPHRCARRTPVAGWSLADPRGQI